jgi:DNA polymerase-1
MAKDKFKKTLVNTPLKEAKFLAYLEQADGDVGFDTEVAAPLLRDRKSFINISYSALLGFSIAFEDKQTFYLPVRHKGSNCSYRTQRKAWRYLQERAAEGAVWAHNAKFDHQVAIQEGFPLEGLLDSMVAAWLQTGRHTGIGLKVLAKEVLGRESPEYDPTIQFKTAQEVFEYACHDALNTLEVGLHFTNGWTEQQWDWFRTECRFAHSLAEMKLHGIGLDFKQLTSTLARAEAKEAALLKRWDEIAPKVEGQPVSISSTKQLQELYNRGLWLAEKRTKTGLASTARTAMLFQIENETPGAELAQLRLDFQEVHKIIGTYTEGLIEEALQWHDRRLHPDLHHFGTVTGRLSSSNPNIQNQPSHGEWAPEIKKSYIPSPDCEFTSADYSQVELRYFADYCGGKLLQAFMDGADLHQVTADALGVERSVGKTINFGFLLYGGGPNKMADLLRCSYGEAKVAIERLQRKYPRIEAWRAHVIKTTLERATVMPMVKTKAGRVRYIPELNPEAFMKNLEPEQQEKMWSDMAAKYDLSPHMDKEKLKKSIFSRGKRLVVNYLVQGGCRDVLILGMDEYRKNAPEGFRLVTTVHDEVLTEHPEGRGEEARELLKTSLEGVGKKLGLRVPLIAEPQTGKNWYEVK